MKRIFVLVLLMSLSNVLWSQVSPVECGESIYIEVRQMPMYIGDLGLVLKNISEEVDSQMKKLLKNDNIQVDFLVTCSGEVVISSPNQRVTDFCSLMTERLNKQLKWIPGRHNGVAVNVMTVVPVRVISGRIILPLTFSQVTGSLIRCTIVDRITNAPISNVRLMTRSNKSAFFSDPNGVVEFYCEENAEVEISHISYKSFKFVLPDDISTLKVKLDYLTYVLEPLDLIRNSPRKIPYKRMSCSFKDWKDRQENFVILSEPVDAYPSESSVFNGGYECFYNYIAQKFELTKLAYTNGYTDTVDVSFVVSKTGFVENFVLSKELKYGQDSVLHLLFSGMPRWKPATQAKESVDQRYVINIIFGKNSYWDAIYE